MKRIFLTAVIACFTVSAFTPTQLYAARKKKPAAAAKKGGKKGKKALAGKKETKDWTLIGQILSTDGKKCYFYPDPKQMKQSLWSFDIDVKKWSAFTKNAKNLDSKKVTDYIDKRVKLTFNADTEPRGGDAVKFAQINSFKKLEVLADKKK